MADRCEAGPIAGLGGVNERIGCKRCDASWDDGDIPPPCKPRNAGDLLSAAAATYVRKSAEYGESYKHMGGLLIALFPEGVPSCSTVDEANRLNLIVNCASKLQRYCRNFAKGGHQDSAHDLTVYAAMLEEMTK